jgi:hypothetical protein
MPIRFRCCYCRQLLGIAQRKVGTVTKCPTCLGHVWVPDPDQAEEDQPEEGPPTGTNDSPDAELMREAPEFEPVHAPIIPLPPRQTTAGLITVIVFVVIFFVVGVLIGRGLQR